MDIRIEDDEKIITTYSRFFQRRGDSKGSGYGFPCDKAGNVEELNKLAEGNYQKCISGEYDVIDMGVQSREDRIRLCSCGSGEEPEEVYDARGIFIANVCSKCRKDRLKGYRLDVLNDPNYECDEPIEEDY